MKSAMHSFTVHQLHHALHIMA
ncbi:hypothetical protein CFP56_007349 [Quercus suber]|uniref:Uncharacterized protein n=1 Tax=Quercus suber TaxID=58331 RepID=A0AAW0IDR6_QUESU